MKEPPLTEKEHQRLKQCVATTLSEKQIKWACDSGKSFARQETVLAVHWHPEFVPMELIRKRIDTTFPDKKEELVIPTQHNQLMEYDDYAGVEVDCHSQGFKRKVQLLLHFEKKRIENAAVLKNILQHTFTYRSSQLFSFLRALTKPDETILSHAAEATGAPPDVVDFARHHAARLEKLLDATYDEVPRESIKNKIVRDYFDLLRPENEAAFINRAQNFLQAVKIEVKKDFPLNYFYRTNEVIEEVRHIGGGIVIPHPEQFWPILLADYDVDGYEVWNPQSLEYTEFLITVLHKRNLRANGSRSLLVFMGDDTHMSEKVKDPAVRDKAKGCREIGVQPPWDDMHIRKQLLKAGMDRPQVIREYKDRLAI